MKRNVLTLCVVAALCVWTAVRQRDGARAAATDATTWGANDPTWAPDGKRLAVTLFGSIWETPAAGGPARQITAGDGYDAHPAWSPKGGRIAFIRGGPPAGRLPNITGRLMVVSEAGGDEREIRTPFPTAGAPTWSPDGTRIACALLTPDGGGALHYEIDAETGAARELQQRPQRSPSGTFWFASWSPRNGEIFVSGQRYTAPNNGSRKYGAPQISTIPTADRPISVILPLTRYRASDIAQLHGVSALPDGSGAIYSGVVVNGKGDHDLFRVPREGGAPVALTRTTRDEFAPAVSPDGSTVAHVSNHLGNIDVFLMPASGGEKKHVRITELRFARPAARLRVKTLDETGQPSPVRLFVRAADGKAYAPQGAPVFYHALDMGGPREGFFLTHGEDEFAVPAGVVRLTALKGVEYRVAEQSVEAEAGRTTEVTFRMERWTNWSQKGWWTGENHFHANYNGSYYQRPPDSLQWLEAEDLNAANMIVANSEGAFVHDKEFFKGRVDTISKPRYVLYWGQEYRNTDPLGHMAFLNIRAQVPPSFTTVVGSAAPYDFPLNTMAAQEARRQGGLVVYVHPISGNQRDPLDTSLGAKEAPVTAALGAMDAIDVLPFGPQAYEMWYRLLNSGFRIAPGAGTDVFTNYRGINRIPGAARQYVEVGSGMNWGRWIEKYREGRVFVTNGPLVTFTVNGQGPGSVITGQDITARVSAEVTARMPIDKVELIRNGEVIQTVDGAGRTAVRLEGEHPVRRSAWLAVRVTGRAARGVPEPARAHTGAVYVHAGGQPVLIREDVQLMMRWIGALWGFLEERDHWGSRENRARARVMFDQALAHYRAKLASAI